MGDAVEAAGGSRCESQLLSFFLWRDAWSEEVYFSWWLGAMFWSFWGDVHQKKAFKYKSPPLFFLKLHMRLNKKLPRKWNLPLVLTNGFLESFLCENGNTIRLWITFLHWYDFPLARTEFQGIICIFLHLGFSSTIGEYIEVPEWLYQCCMILPSVLAWVLRGCWA